MNPSAPATNNTPRRGKEKRSEKDGEKIEERIGKRDKESGKERKGEQRRGVEKIFGVTGIANNRSE